MATPVGALGEELLARLHALFLEDPSIDEIGLLFGVEAENLTVDSAFVLADHKLGVAFSAGTIVFHAARTRFHVLNAQLRAGAITQEDAYASTRAELLACCRAVVLISADFYTAWNTRKEYVRRGWLQPQDEATFTNLVFSLHPKSIDTWAYRRWLATRLCEELEGDELDGFFLAQAEVCAVLAERSPRNYHAWSFRHWIVSRFQTVEQLTRELVAMDRWCETHLTDHSGWNHRQHTIKCLLFKLRTNDAAETIEQDVERLLREFEFLSGILAKYPVYEALWCHRRFVMQELLARRVSCVEAPDEAGVFWEKEALRDMTIAETMNGAEWLINQWRHVRASLAHSATAPSGVLEDIAIAWRCGNKFARRYAAWLLQRLQARSPGSFRQLSLSMRLALSEEDALLEHLWLT